MVHYKLRGVKSLCYFTLFCTFSKHCEKLRNNVVVHISQIIKNLFISTCTTILSLIISVLNAVTQGKQEVSVIIPTN